MGILSLVSLWSYDSAVRCWLTVGGGDGWMGGGGTGLDACGRTAVAALQVSVARGE